MSMTVDRADLQAFHEEAARKWLAAVEAIDRLPPVGPWAAVKTIFEGLAAQIELQGKISLKAIQQVDRIAGIVAGAATAPEEAPPDASV